jgi:ribosomal protein S30
MDFDSARLPICAENTLRQNVEKIHRSDARKIIQKHAEKYGERCLFEARQNADKIRGQTPKILARDARKNIEKNACSRQDKMRTQLTVQTPEKLSR